MPPSILVVDPIRQARDFTISMFQSLGYRYVWPAEDVARTRNFLDAVLFDYVLLDAHISGAPIHELIAAIRRSAPQTTIVVLSHLPQAGSRYPGADYVISKPLSFPELSRLMEQRRVTSLR